MADRIITDDRLREIATANPLALAICASVGEPSWADVRAIAAQLIAARAEVERLRADLREALQLLRAAQWPCAHDDHDWVQMVKALLAKHQETP